MRLGWRVSLVGGTGGGEAIKCLGQWASRESNGLGSDSEKEREVSPYYCFIDFAQVESASLDIVQEARLCSSRLGSRCVSENEQWWNWGLNSIEKGANRSGRLFEGFVQRP